MLDEQSTTRHLLKLVAPVRKAAGSVRDMDVLTAHALTLQADGEEDCVVHLLEHLGSMRMESARELESIIGERKKKIRRDIKRCAKAIRRSVSNKDADSENRTGQKGAIDEPAQSPAAVVLKLAEEIKTWPPLNADNIHLFRIKLKLLGYILQLAQRPNDRLVAELGDVKDLIGEWHDWRKLATISEDVLDEASKRDLIKEIRSIERMRLRQAINAANALRTKYFNQRSTRKVRGKQSDVAFSASLLSSAASLTG
jgi:CHAD domain-containing protein